MTLKPTLAQLRRFVGNPHAYAEQQTDGSWYPVRKPLTDIVLQQHLEQKRTVGTYIGHRPMGEQPGETVSRTLCFDIDNGSYSDAQAIRGSLVHDFGVHASSVGIEFSGKKGYHVWLVLQDYRPNAELRRAGRATLAVTGIECEVYPKQDAVRDLGNLVKLPGGKHQVSGSANDFVDLIPTPLPQARWQELLSRFPKEQRVRRASGGEVRFPCMEVIQNEGVSEGGRNIQLYHLATMLRRAGVTNENVQRIIHHTNNLGQPLEETEVDELLLQSTLAGPICEQLPEDRQCGELCIKERTSGLYARPGQFRYAAIGEGVVVTVIGRKGKVIELEHGDVSKMKAVLK